MIPFSNTVYLVEGEHDFRPDVTLGGELGAIDLTDARLILVKVARPDGRLLYEGECRFGMLPGQVTMPPGAWDVIYRHEHTHPDAVAVIIDFKVIFRNGKLQTYPSSDYMKIKFKRAPADVVETPLYSDSAMYQVRPKQPDEVKQVLIDMLRSAVIGMEVGDWFKVERVDGELGRMFTITTPAPVKKDDE